jgi:hypothetical protein
MEVKLFSGYFKETRKKNGGYRNVLGVSVKAMPK